MGVSLILKPSNAWHLILTWNFWRHSQDISGLFPNHFLYICQSVCQSLYLFQLVISGGQLLRPLVLFDYSSCMYLWQKSLDCISLKWFSACLVFMPTICTANEKPPIIDIQPLKYYNYFPTTSNDQFEAVKKDQQIIGWTWITCRALQSCFNVSAVKS